MEREENGGVALRGEGDVIIEEKEWEVEERSALMEEQLLLSGWTWGEGPGTKHPFDQEPRRSAVEMWGSQIVEPCQTHLLPALKPNNSLRRPKVCISRHQHPPKSSNLPASV